MTLIIGIKDTEAIHLACDTQGSTQYSKNYYQPKVFKDTSHDHIIYGVSGCYRIMNILETNSFFNKESIKILRLENKQADRTFIIKNFIPNLINHLTECKDIILKDLTFSILLGIDKKLFHIPANFSVLETQDLFDAIGSGSDRARTILNTTKDVPIKARVKQVYNSTSKYDNFVGGKTYIINTNDTTLKEVK